METGERWRLGHRPALDGLRGVAVLLVLAMHIELPGFKHSAGHIGVAVFFTLSGFLIATLLLQERELTGGLDLRRFYRNRALRLLPALVAVVVASVALTWATGVELVTTSEVVGALLYCSNIIGVFIPPEPGMLHHTWSLVLEEQFYLVWPMLMLAMWRRRHALLALLVAIAIFSAVQRFRLLLADGVEVERVLFGTDTRIDGIVIGCALAVMLHGRRLPRMPEVASSVSLAVILAFAVAPGVAGFVLGLTPTGIATAVVIVAVLAGTSPRWLEVQPLRTVGRVSYGLYLWHHVVLIFAVEVLGVEGWMMLAVAVVPASAVLTALSWRYIEQPFLRLKDVPTGARRVAGSMTAVTVTR